MTQPESEDRVQQVISQSRAAMNRILELFDDLDEALTELETETRRQSSREDNK